MAQYINVKDLPITLLLCFLGISPLGSTLQVTPQTYKEDNRRFLQFTCGEYLKSRNQLLCWYQIKGSKRKLLTMIQQDDDYFLSQWREVVLYKTLEQSDYGTEIFCAKQRARSDGSFSTEEESRKIRITFHRNIQFLERPYITVDPSTDIIIFDENDVLNFNCTGSRTIDSRKYTWYLQGENFKYTKPSEQIFDVTRNINKLKLRLNKYHHQSLLLCAQDYHFHLQLRGKASKMLRYGELVTSKMIKLFHRSQGDSSASPLVTPEKILDNNNTHILFSCYAFLRERELLSWYQVKGSDTILLRMTQLQNPVYEGGQWIFLTLNKTLMYSDNGTNFYCAKQCMMPDGNFSAGLESQLIPIMFKKEIEPSETPFVAIQPKDTTVYFDVNSTLYFNCSGSEPVDGRNYTWFMKDPDSTLMPLDQNYDASTNRNSLSLLLNDSHHGNQLFCAQEYILYIEHVNGSWVKTYGELARSNMITLVEWERVKTQLLFMTILLPLLLVVLMVITIVVVVVVRRRRRTLGPSGAEHKDDIYTYAYAGRVTYANVDLPSSTAAYATSVARSESTRYVNIVGACYPKSGACE